MERSRTQGSRVAAAVWNTGKERKVADPGRESDQNLGILEEAVLTVLRQTYPDALKATEISDALGIVRPRRGYDNYLIDSAVKRLEKRGFVEQTNERGPWRLTVT